MQNDELKDISKKILKKFPQYNNLELNIQNTGNESIIACMNPEEIEKFGTSDEFLNEIINALNNHFDAKYKYFALQTTGDYPPNNTDTKCLVFIKK